MLNKELYDTIRSRYRIALATVALLFTVSVLILQNVIHAQGDTVGAVNASGMQRMLSQRIALYSNKLVNVNPHMTATRAHVTEMLSDALKRFETNHLRLSQKENLSEALQQLYFSGDPSLDQLCRQVINTARQQLTNIEAPVVEVALAEEILPRLDQVVSQFELEARQRVDLFGWLEWLLWAVAMLLLVVVAKTIFQPMARKIVENVDEIDDARLEAEHLQHLAEVANQKKTEFLDTITHELRTPMNGVIGMLTMLSEEEMSVDQRKKTELAQKSADELMGVIDDILSYLHIEDDVAERHDEVFALSSEFDALLDSYSAEAKAKGLDFSVDNQIPDINVEAPRDSIRRILKSLLDNAVKFTHEGKVTVELKLTQPNGDGRQVMFRVADTGIGIAPEDMEDMFEPLTQLDSSTTRTYAGIGMGLAICRQYCDRLGGGVSAVSQKDYGSEFTAHVPVQLMTSPVAAEPAPLRAPVSAKVLIVEDNRINQLVIESMLLDSGFHCQMVSNGQLAIEALQQAIDDGAFDVVIMDCQMPLLDGYETSEMIRRGDAGEHCRNIPIIAVTASVTPEAQQRCRDAGMNAFHAKPIEPTVLLETVRQWIDPV